jgi:hypothetical protein
VIGKLYNKDLVIATLTDASSMFDAEINCRIWSRILEFKKSDRKEVV